MQYKIPQNVRIEDKIVGPLTMKQLGIMAVGGGLTYVTYVFLAKRYYIEVWLPPTAFFGLLTLAFTFLEINGNSFAKWLLLLLEYFVNKRKRTFVLGGADNYQESLFAEKEKNAQTTASPAPTELNSKERLKKISEISRIVDESTVQPINPR